MRKNSRSERGQALMGTIIAVSLVLLALLTTLTLTDMSRRVLSRQLTYNGQALNAAQAGLVEGLSWFRRQTTQPVATFVPIQNLSATPPIDDTESPTIGLVRTYQISSLGNLWGRYELRKTGYTGGTNTMDISGQKTVNGTGVVWQLESIGTVFVKNNPAAAYNVSPNVVLTRRTLRNEIQRLGVNVPAGACALSVNRSNCITLSNTAVSINGNGSAAIGWVNSPASGTPTGSGYPSSVTGTASASINSAPKTGYPDKFSVPAVFGVTLNSLLAQSDYNVTSVSQLPTILPQLKLIVLNNPGTTFTFTQARPLTGSGILVVLGNLTLAPNSNSIWNGVIYVQGSYIQNQPSTIQGAVIVDDTAAAGTTSVAVNLSGAGEKAIINYDADVINLVTTQMGLYAQSRAPYDPCTSGPGCS